MNETEQTVHDGWTRHILYEILNMSLSPTSTHTTKTEQRNLCAISPDHNYNHSDEKLSPLERRTKNNEKMLYNNVVVRDR
jgi:hypothetical protein